MFDLFRRRTAKEFIDEAKDMYNVPHNYMPTAATEQSDTGSWTVGSDNGSVVIKISSGTGHTMTMTLPPKDAKKLVRMINSAMEE